MSDEISQILKSVRVMTQSMGGMREEFVRMKTEHKAMGGSVDNLSREVKVLNESVIRLDGKSKGLRADVKRIENSVAMEIKELKTADLPLLVKAEVSRAKEDVSTAVQAHEDRFMHKQKGTSNTTIKRPSQPPQDNRLTVPKWIVYLGGFFGATVIGGAALIYIIFF